jgi:type IV pilus assembly protein PilB
VTAALFESVLEAAGLDGPTLESLLEIYARLGDQERLALTRSRLSALAAAPPPSAAPVPLGEAAVYVPPPGAAPSPAPAVSAGPAPSLTPTLPGGRGLTLAGSSPAVARSGEGATERGRAFRRRGRLGDVLLAEGLISPAQLHEALREHRRSKERLGKVLTRRGLLSEEQLVEVLSKEHGLPSVAIDDYVVTSDVLALVPPHIARRYEVIPLARVADGLTLAMADPTNVVAMDEVSAMTRLAVLPVVASGRAIRAAIDRYYATTPLQDLLAELASDTASLEVVPDEAFAPGDAIELKESAEDPPVVRLVNTILLDAIRRGASDLHWEPYENDFRIRFRVDGVLHEIAAPPKRHEAAIISRLKIMANLDIAERRLPQDGRIKLRHRRREIDFRLSILPTIFGEKAVLRVLDREALQLDLTRLGFDRWSFERFSHAIRQPYGMVLITGPTGSGKTTTLYSAISTINAPGHNIMTVEDPVEYNLPGVNQVQVNEGIGRTFAGVLRSFLRQDPDVILVGETRDLETAQISIRAALTGHLVFTTLHTNDCPSTVARLVDMGVPPFLLSSALVLVVAQRLARRVCPECREASDGHEEDLVPYGHVPEGRGRVTFVRGRGCRACSFSGMRGRVALYEVMPVTDELRHLIVRNAPTAAIRELAQAQGLKTLRQAGLVKVLDGLTTLQEVLRVTLG